MKRDLFIPNEIKDIVTSLKSIFNINSIAEVDGVSTINTQTLTIFNNLSDAMLLVEGMIIEMDDINYVVSNIVNTTTLKTFDVTATGLTASTWNVAANFQTGSRYEINQILKQDATSLDRFPLIWVLPATDEDNDHPVLDFTATVNIVFAHKANKTDRTEKRITNNFEPVIQPLMNLFNKWLTSSDFNYMLEFSGYGKPVNYSKSNFPFYGTSDQSKSVLNTTTDAIEVNYDLSFKNQYIEPVSPDGLELLSGGHLLLLG